ncbi:hypothetical protein N0V90_000455 [Kalmusia sp. IMI 367209]|nr:hypothetical protein N0V90_000455 [Kalmusia sp. IMI 367209]
MDPFSALGLASNLVQFVDFGTRVSGRIYELYNSASGFAANQSEVVDMAARLRQLADRLSQATSTVEEGASPIVDKKSYMSLLFLCRSTAQDLMDIVEDLKVDKSQRLWSSIRQGFRATRKREQIEQLINRVKTLQDSLNSYLLALLQDSQSKVFQGLQNLVNDEARMQIEWKVDLRKMRDDILEEVRKQQRHSFNFTPIQMIPNGPPVKPPSIEKKMAFLASNREGLCSLSSTLGELATNGLTISRAQQILTSLYSPDMQLRESAIGTAHHHTFDWLYPTSDYESENTLANWLRSGEGVYWVAGKAGSGKSTLLKHIVRSPKTLELLRPWATPRELVLCSYFFWNAGSRLQKSQQGLIQSLLFDILRLCPELIQQIFTDDDVYNTPISWDHDSLMVALQKTLRFSIDRYRFCFIIDGLDEYEGDHHELVHMLRTDFSSESMKILLSSRPWNVFQEAFGRKSEAYLCLEDHTKEDILNYVNNTMERSLAFVELKNIDTRCEKLVQDIVKRAQGVFIWVVLVVRSLIRGFSNADTFEDLQKRLHAFPRELGPFFRHMYDSIEPMYRQEAAKYFQVASTARSSYRLLTYDLLCATDLENVILTYLRGIEWGDSSHQARLQQAKKRVNARTQGLLETFGQDNLKVDFYHRSVQDFLHLQDMQDILSADLPDGWDSDFDLCRIFLAEVKCIPEMDHPTSQHATRDTRSTLKISNIGPAFDSRAFNTIKLDFLYHAYRVEQKSGKAPVSLMEDFSETLETAFSIMDTQDPFRDSVETGENSFLEEAVYNGLIHFPAHKFLKEPHLLSVSARHALLCHILYSGMTIIQDQYGVCEIVRVLMRRFADDDTIVNINMDASVIALKSDRLQDGRSKGLQVTLKSPWQMFLFNAYYSMIDDTRDTAVLLDLARILIRAGADQFVRVEVSRSKSLEPSDIFLQAFKATEAEELLTLLQDLAPTKLPMIKVERTATVKIAEESEHNATSQPVVNWFANWSPFKSKS